MSKKDETVLVPADNSSIERERKNGLLTRLGSALSVPMNDTKAGYRLISRNPNASAAIFAFFSLISLLPLAPSILYFIISPILFIGLHTVFKILFKGTNWVSGSARYLSGKSDSSPPSLKAAINSEDEGD